MTNELQLFTSPEGQKFYRAFKRGRGWAEIFIGEKGQFVAHSDYGTYSYCWTAVGGDENKPYLLRVMRFIASVGKSPDYFINKLSAGPLIFDEKSFTEAKSLILELRRVGTLTKKQAREEWDSACYHQHDGEYGWTLFWQDSKLDQYGEYPGRRKPAIDATHFVERVMVPWLAPLLAGYLDELSNES